MISSDQKQCVGYVCGTVLCLGLLMVDGEVAIMTAAGCAAAMFGVQAFTNARQNSRKQA